MNFALRSLLILTLTLSACTYGTQGIFYAVANEEKTPDNGASMNNKLTVTAMDEIASTHFVAGSRLFYRAAAASSGDWSIMDISSKTGGLTRVISLTSAPGGTDFYLIVADNAGTTAKLFKTGNSGPAAATWTQVTVPAGETPAGFTKVTDATGAYANLYLVTLAASAINPALTQKKVYVFTGANVAGGNLDFKQSDGTTAAELAAMPVQAAFNGSTYYLAAGNQLYTSVTLGSGFVAETSAHVGTQELGGVLAVTDLAKTGQGVIVLVSSVGGTIRVFENSVWSVVVTGKLRQSSDTTSVSFGTLQLFDISGAGTSKRVLVGSRPANSTYAGFGYMEISGSEVVATPGTYTYSVLFPVTTANTNNYTPSTLKDASTNFLFVNSANKLYVGTSGAGLWYLDNASKNWTVQ